MTDRILSVISLAKKAGRISSGETAVLGDIKRFKSCLVLIAGDASEGTRKKFTDKCSFYEVECRVYGTREKLGSAIGRDLRSVVSVNDEGFAGTILDRLEEAGINGK